MKPRILANPSKTLQTSCNILLLISWSLILRIEENDAAIVPPPWSDPVKNPCASMPGGWQLLYWPPLKKCFKIFTIGHPCPDTMELGPTATVGGLSRNGTRNAPIAECRCPPSTALSSKTNQCHAIFERGPCEIGEYFAPIADKTNIRHHHTQHRWGECRLPIQCPANMIYWPKDGKCYVEYTKGPCTKGKLLILNDDNLAECKCERSGVLGNYFYANENTCHEHFTKGPCSTPGHLFLPGGRCDCHDQLPHFNKELAMCFELNTLGPCPPGHIYTKSVSSTHAKCQCKEGYVPWKNGSCYRLYTRGPCAANEFLINATNCVTNFCGKSRLYFPDQKSCYRIGSQGPCDLHQVVVFDFTARPSIDGISYNGMCGCSGVISNLDQQCNPNENKANPMGSLVIGFGTATNVQLSNNAALLGPAPNSCESAPGMVEIKRICYKLYTQGPCGPGQWLAPLKSQIDLSKSGAAATPLHLLRASNKAKCVCRPGYTLAENDENDQFDTNIIKQRCNAPSVGLARYLNVHQRINSKFSAQSTNQANLTDFSSDASSIYRFFIS